MIQNENLIKLIKKDTQNSLNFYKNLVQDSFLNSKDLVEKASDVRERLNSGQKINKNQPQEIPNFSKQIKQEIKNQKNLQSIEKTSFRKDAKTTPKIQIFNQRVKSDAKRLPKSQGVLSFYDSDNSTFFPVSNILSTDTTSTTDEAVKKAEQRTKIVRNNIDYDSKIKPLFFTNRYVEYSYQDRGDNLYEDGDLFRYLFDKKMKKDKNPGLYIVKQDSIYLETFKKLLKKIKDEKEEEIIKCSNDSSGREGDEDILASDEQKKINRYKNFKNETKSKSSSSGGGGGEGEEEKETKSTNFKTFFLSKISLCENNAIAAANDESDGDWNMEKENPSLGKSVGDVSFNIDIEAQMLKKTNGKSKKEISRNFKINGPIVSIYKIPSENKDIQSVQEKGKFDIRHIKIEEEENKQNNNNKINPKISDLNNINNEYGIRKFHRESLNLNLSLLNDKEYREEFFIKKITKNGKEIAKQIQFFSRKIKELQNKTFCDLFLQLQKYYKDFLINIENASYHSLKFLSNPNCTSLELCPTESKKILEHLYWHPKVQSLTIPASFVALLKQVMDSRKWECIITSLTIIQDVGVSSPPFEESLHKLFSGINSIPIQNIHLIDVPYDRKIADALFNHIDLFYSINNTTLNNFFDFEKTNNYNLDGSDKEITSSEDVDDPKTTLFLNIQKTKLPIINLSWKKTPNSKMRNSKSEESIDLRAIYYILMNMLIKAYKFNKKKLPEVFNKLDISETIVTDDVGFLVKIITQFKIIKELDISNTKLFSYGKVINSENFLRKIKLTNKFTKVITPEDESAFMEHVLKDINFFRNCTEQEKSKLSDYLKDEEMCYDLFMGILPILEKIYVYNTDIRESVARDIYMLFRKLKFFHGFYCSSSSNNNIFLNTINSLTDTIQNDSGNFCENIFRVS